jgi:hypothetical protein
MIVSDNRGFRFNLGDLTQRRHMDRRTDGNISRYTFRRPLIEETLSVDTRGLRQIHGREKLLRAADDGRPITVQLGGHSFQVFLTWEPHQLPGHVRRWSDVSQGNARIYLLCDSCRRKVRILYKSPLSPVSNLSTLGCRRCLHLVYACENSGKTKWWGEIVRPLRHLYRRREKLLARKRTHKVTEELYRIEELIFVYTKRAEPKRKTRHTSGIRRPYKNVSRILSLR